MLIEFSVGNFRSFKDIVTLSMVAAKLTAKNKALDEDNVFESPGAPQLLTSAAVYGANASGKSNLIAAIVFMRRFVLTSQKETQPTGSIGVEAFRMDPDVATQASHFEIVFLNEGTRYRYGFEVTNERVSPNGYTSFLQQKKRSYSNVMGRKLVWAKGSGKEKTSRSVRGPTLYSSRL